MTRDSYCMTYEQAKKRYPKAAKIVHTIGAWLIFNTLTEYNEYLRSI